MMCSSVDKLLTVVFIFGMVIGMIVHGGFELSDVLLLLIAALLFHFIRKLSITEFVRHIHK